MPEVYEGVITTSNSTPTICKTIQYPSTCRICIIESRISAKDSNNEVGNILKYSALLRISKISNNLEKSQIIKNNIKAGTISGANVDVGFTSNNSDDNINMVVTGVDGVTIEWKYSFMVTML